MTAHRAPLWDASTVRDFLRREFPQEFGKGHYEIAKLTRSSIDMVLHASDHHLRPGGTVSGPSVMALMDCAAYALLIGRHGETGKLAVTTGMSLSFLRKSGPGQLHCSIEFLKEGRTLTVVDARVWNADRTKLLAHGEFTYHLDLWEEDTVT
ncbi:MAG: PaaI family thioesterase [Hyphomicrobiales bacterium]